MAHDLTYNPADGTVLMSWAPFSTIYGDLLETLLTDNPEYVDTEVNQRTGSEIKALLGGTSFKLDLSSRQMPMPGFRKFHCKSALAEVAWFVSGTRDVTWLKQYAPLWDKFVEDDGVTIDAAYGYRWRVHFGRDQLSSAIAALQANPSDRRVYVSNWDPGYDGLGAPNQKNVPCPLGFTLSLVAGALHSTLTIRSSDVFVGLPYDTAGHALLMDAIAAELGVKLGTMTVTLAHPHLYECHYDMARECLKQDLTDDMEEPAMLGWSLSQIEKYPDDYVETNRMWLSRVRQVSYNPIPEVVV